jgi:hypothetical protein
MILNGMIERDIRIRVEVEITENNNYTWKRDPTEYAKEVIGKMTCSKFDIMLYSEIYPEVNVIKVFINDFQTMQFIRETI